MVDLLVKLLGPFMYSLGVSEADLISYLTQLQGYIYGIVVAAVVLVLVMGLAHFVKKRSSRSRSYRSFYGISGCNPDYY